MMRSEGRLVIHGHPSHEAATRSTRCPCGSSLAKWPAAKEPSSWHKPVERRNATVRVKPARKSRGVREYPLSGFGRGECHVARFPVLIREIHGEVPIRQ